MDHQNGSGADAAGNPVRWQRTRRAGDRLLRAVTAVAWWGLALWMALAVFFTAPLPVWVTVPLTIAIMGLYYVARREWDTLRDLAGRPWKEKYRTTAALSITALFAVWYLGFVSPDPNQDWAPEQARMPIVTIEGDKIHVKDVRNFTWHSATEFTPGFYERVYDLSKLNSMYYVVAPIPIKDMKFVAHVFVCFGFSDGQHVAVSVEGRRVKGRPYRLIPSLFRQYQLIYVVGDERDVVGLRGAIWNQPVFFYPARTTTERKRAIFRDMMQRAHDLEEEPEFYHLIVNNCMTNITGHIRRLGGHSLPHDLRLLLTGLSDRVAYRLGYIDTDLPFASARQAFRIDRWMEQTPLDAGFSKRLRERIRQQVAQARQKLADKRR